MIACAFADALLLLGLDPIRDLARAAHVRGVHTDVLGRLDPDAGLEVGPVVDAPIMTGCREVNVGDLAPGPAPRVEVLHRPAICSYCGLPSGR